MFSWHYSIPSRRSRKDILLTIAVEDSLVTKVTDSSFVTHEDRSLSFVRNRHTLRPVAEGEVRETPTGTVVDLTVRLSKMDMIGLFILSIAGVITALVSALSVGSVLLGVLIFVLILLTIAAALVVTVLIIKHRGKRLLKKITSLIS